MVHPGNRKKRYRRHPKPKNQQKLNVANRNLRMYRTLQRAMRIGQKVKRRRVNPLLTLKKHLLQPGKKRMSRRMRKISKAVPTGGAVQRYLEKLSTHEIHAKNGKRENDGKIG